MTRCMALGAVLLLAASTAGASNAVSLGYSENTTIVAPGTDACASGVLIHNHDGSFENGYAWQYDGTVPPYYGALAEAYDLGVGTVACGVFWLSSMPSWQYDVPSDCYVWEGGVGSPPGPVVGLVVGVQFPQVPDWPVVRQYDIEMNIAVTGSFTVGYWGDWPGSDCQYFCGADESGPRGHPWTCIAPGIGYPSGWQDPAIVGGYWGPTKSMGCGVYFESNPTPAESPTWGAINAMFR